MVEYLCTLLHQRVQLARYINCQYKLVRIDSFSLQLRLQYEVNPMAYIIEAAGGKSTNGDIPSLDIVPKTIHDRAAIFIGSADNVDDFLKVRQQFK